MNPIGVVAIGRNEGERLRRCLESVVGRVPVVVYVDSGSTDGSRDLARSLGVEVVELDLARPFTAARARNEGLATLCRIAPDVRFVQFVDGDCEIVPGWLEEGQRVLEKQPEVAVVCGRRRERYPENSPYNRLADIEWNTPVGVTRACGGDAMMRVEAVRGVGGFNGSLIAGEEPELCVRLRQAGWLILRLDAEMTLHDMAMTRFGQWWRRAERAGHAYAEGAALHGGPPEYHWVREVCSITLWGLALPLLILGLAWPTAGTSLLAAAAYPAQWLRITTREQRRGMPARDARLYAWGCVVSRFPNALGMLRYVAGRVRRRRPTLIEYKGDAPPRHAGQPRSYPGASCQ